MTRAWVLALPIAAAACAAEPPPGLVDRCRAYGIRDGTGAMAGCVRDLRLAGRGGAQRTADARAAPSSPAPAIVP